MVVILYRFSGTSSLEVPDSMRLRKLAGRRKDDKIRTEYIRTENPDDFPPSGILLRLVAHPKSYFIVFFTNSLQALPRMHETRHFYTWLFAKIYGG